MGSVNHEIFHYVIHFKIYILSHFCTEISYHVLCCQSSCYNDFLLAIIFKSVLAKILLQHWKQTIFPWRRIPLLNHYRFWLFNYEIIRNASLLSNRLSYVGDQNGASATVIVTVTLNVLMFLTQLAFNSSASGCEIFICTMGLGV